MNYLDLKIAIDNLVYSKFNGKTPTAEQVENWGDELKDMIDSSVEQYIEEELGNSEYDD